jgi:hypothetical protein
MPVTYEFDPDFGFVWTRCVGATTLDEVRAHFAGLEMDPTTPARLDVLLDLSMMTSLPESNQLQAIVDELRRLKPRIDWGACAIVAVNDALFGMSRMFEVFAAQQFTRTRVFRDFSTARNWLIQSA